MQAESPELLELEKQLSHPSGEKGVEVADMMHATNIGMTRATILQLGLEAGQHVLELGHGNCSHLPMLLEQAPDLHYTGLEISDGMHSEALRLNAVHVQTGRVTFERYAGSRLPFPDGSFDRMLAVNCIYFWPDPEALLLDICRVLRPGGYAALTYADKSFMQQLPFVGRRFRLYDDATFAELAAGTSFADAHMHHETEQIRTKTGDLAERRFTVAVLRKP